MFLKTQDPNTAKELMEAGAELVDEKFGCWIFMEASNFELTERQKKYVVKSPILTI